MTLVGWVEESFGDEHPARASDKKLLPSSCRIFAEAAATQPTVYPTMAGSGSPSGINRMEIELTQCRVFLSVSRSPWKT